MCVEISSAFLFFELIKKKIKGQIIFYRQSCLPMLNRCLSTERSLWGEYKDCNAYYADVKSFEESLEHKTNKPSIEDLSAWTIPSIHMGQLMLTWRLRVQNFEKSLNDPEIKIHHSTRIKGSMPGPLIKPDDDRKPTVTSIKQASKKKWQFVESALNLLSLTSWNWAEFTNKNSLVMKYIKIVIYSLELHKIYNDPFKIKQSCKIFLSIFEEIKDHLNEDILVAVMPPKLQDKEKEDNPNITSNIHHEVAHMHLEEFNQELNDGLKALLGIGQKYGHVNQKYPESFVKPVNLILVYIVFDV